MADIKKTIGVPLDDDALDKVTGGTVYPLDIHIDPTDKLNLKYTTIPDPSTDAYLAPSTSAYPDFYLDPSVDLAQNFAQDIERCSERSKIITVTDEMLDMLVIQKNIMIK